MIAYHKFVPRGSFLASYMNQFSKGETPYAYDFWGGMFLLATAIGRTCVVNRPGAPVYLNPYIILTAQSGITRKSTAIKAVGNVLDAMVRLDPSWCYTFRTKTYPHKVKEELGEFCNVHNHAACSFCYSELAADMGKSTYMAEMPVLLTDWYDCPTRRVVSKESTLTSIYPTFISATTPEWLLSRLSADLIGGGFVSRCLYIHADKPKRRVPWPESVSEDADFASESAEELNLYRTMGKSVGNITIIPAAKTRFVNWYTNRKLNTDPFRQSFESREDDHILRVAALLSINAKRFEINVADVSNAIKIVQAIKRSSHDLFNLLSPGRSGKSTETQFSSTIRRCDTIKKFFSKRGGDWVKHSIVYRNCGQKITAAELNAYLGVLEDANMIEQKLDDSKVPGRRAVMWRANRNQVEKPMLQLYPVIEARLEQVKDRSYGDD